MNVENLAIMKGAADTALLVGIFWRMGGWAVRLKNVEDWIFKQQEGNKTHGRIF